MAAPGMSFEFATANKIVFGWGCASNELAKALAECGGKYPLLVTGSAVRYGRWTDKISWSGVFEVRGEPTVDTVRDGAAMVSEVGADSVVAFGGGSVIDLAKVISMLATNGGDPTDYLEVIGKGQPITKPSLPFLAVPTTAGTGAEVTKNSVVTSTEHNLKVSVRSSLMLPRVAIVDPELTLTCPPHVTASTGLDAFTQCLEPFVSCMANPVTDALCREGLKCGARSLVKAYTDGNDVNARKDMTLCSLMGGLALANAKLGAVHGFAGVLGGMFPKAPHGALCAALLPKVVTANVAALAVDPVANTDMLSRYKEVAQLCGLQSVEALVSWIEEVGKELKVPPLSEYGMQQQHIADIVAKAAASSSMKGNSITLSMNELTAIVTAAL